MTRLKYLDPADGQYKLLPVGGGSGGPEEVAIAGTKPGSPYTDLWVDTSAPAPVTDWSAGDARYNRAGFRNVVRNGDMQIVQRGHGPFSTYGRTFDGWATGGNGGTATTTHAESSATPSWYNVIAVSGQSAASDYCRYYQAIEDVRTLNGSTVTLSFNAMALSGTPKIAVEIEQVFGSGGSVASPVQVPCGTVTLSTTMARYSLTFQIPSTSGKATGTNRDHVLYLALWVSAGATYASRASNIGIQNNTFYLTDVQLEEGVSATPFERLPVQQQLAWCQRYFQRIGTGNPNVFESGGAFYGHGMQWSGTVHNIQMPLLQPMMVRPTLTSSAMSTFLVFYQGGNQAPTSISPGISAGRLYLTVQLPVSSNQTLVHLKGVGADYFDLSAEL